MRDLSENTLRNYRFWSQAIEKWLGDRALTDELLAEYTTHQAGKAPVPISQAVAAVRWVVKQSRLGSLSCEIVGEVTTRTLAGIWRKGKDVV